VQYFYITGVTRKKTPPSMSTTFRLVEDVVDREVITTTQLRAHK